jgi:phenylalanyl-tRNA synthetase beta chain
VALDAALADRAPYLHPRRSARVDFLGHAAGVLGELHPDVRDATGVEGAVVIAELRVSALFAAIDAARAQRVAPLPRYPSVTRDIAMIVDDGHPVATIAEALRAATGGLAEDVTLFDLYRGDPVPEGKKSVAFRIVYRDPEATLTDKRVDGAHQAVAAAAVQRYGAVVR